jgi:hypothetical protein
MFRSPATSALVCSRGELAPVDGLAELGGDGLAFAFGVVDPRGDRRGVAVLIEHPAVALEALIAVVELSAKLSFSLFGLPVRFRRSGELLAGVVDVVVVEELGQPVVKPANERGLLDVEALGVVDAGIVLGESAAVIGTAVVPLGLHAPVADAAT